jgi:hypothetical protein
MVWSHFYRHTSCAVHRYDTITWSKYCRLILCCKQWISTPGAVTSSYPHRLAGRHAKGIQRITHLIAPLRKISTRLSLLPMEMAQLSAASNILMSSILLAWSYVELFLSFLFLKIVHISHYRRRARHLALQTSIQRVSKAPNSQPTA